MKILFMLPAAKGVYSLAAAQQRIDVIKSYATPSLQIDVDYLPEPSGFVPWGAPADSNHRSLENVQRSHDWGRGARRRRKRKATMRFAPSAASIPVSRWRAHRG
jgi:hypothetical protein